MNEGFEELARQLTKVDQRLSAVDEKFEEVDEKLKEQPDRALWGESENPTNLNKMLSTEINENKK